jgi:hypothetical protein
LNSALNTLIAIPTPIAVLLISTLDETPMNGLEKPIIVYHKKIFCIYNNY